MNHVIVVTKQIINHVIVVMKQITNHVSNDMAAESGHVSVMTNHIHTTWVLGVTC